MILYALHLCITSHFKMRRLLLITALLLTATASRATECVDRTFTYDHLDFYLCQNYSNYNETTSLLYKYRAQQLNRFIADLINNGQLKNKKFNIEIYDRALTYNYINVSQSKYSYDIDCSGFLTFEEIAKIIFYFTQPGWKSFIYDPGKVKDQHKTRQKFIDLVNKYPLPGISAYTSDSISFWQLDDLSVKYNNDNINFYNSKQVLSFKPTSNLPVKIRDRYLFFQQDSIFVFQNGSVILTFKIPAVEEQDYSVDKYDKWINIGFGTEDILYSYSYDRNKFYSLTKKKNGR
jgi:hypothetical protein